MALTRVVKPRRACKRLPVVVSHTNTGAARPRCFSVPSCPDASKAPLPDTSSAHTTLSCPRRRRWSCGSDKLSTTTRLPTALAKCVPPGIACTALLYAPEEPNMCSSCSGEPKSPPAPTPTSPPFSSPAGPGNAAVRGVKRSDRPPERAELLDILFRDVCNREEQRSKGAVGFVHSAGLSDGTRGQHAELARQRQYLFLLVGSLFSLRAGE